MLRERCVEEIPVHKEKLIIFDKHKRKDKIGIFKSTEIKYKYYIHDTIKFRIFFCINESKIQNGTQSRKIGWKIR